MKKLIFCFTVLLLFTVTLNAQIYEHGTRVELSTVNELTTTTPTTKIAVLDPVTNEIKYVEKVDLSSVKAKQSSTAPTTSNWAEFGINQQRSFWFDVSGDEHKLHFYDWGSPDWVELAKKTDLINATTNNLPYKNIAVGDINNSITSDSNLTWNGNQLLLTNTESTIGPAIQVGTNGRDVTTWGQGFTTAMIHRTVDFNSFADMSILDLDALESKGYGSFDTSVKLEGNFPVNHFYGYQARLRWHSNTTLPTESIFNSMAGFMNGGVVESGNVENVVGFLGFNASGNGIIQNQYGVYLNPLTKGTVSNYGIYSLNDNYLQAVTSDEFTGGGANLTNVDAETFDTLNSSQFLRSDVDTYFTSSTYGGINISKDSYLYFGNNKEVDLGFGGADDMYFNLNAANNLFIRNNSNQTIATFKQSNGNFTATGVVEATSYKDNAVNENTSLNQAKLVWNSSNKTFERAYNDGWADLAYNSSNVDVGKSTLQAMIRNDRVIIHGQLTAKNNGFLLVAYLPSNEYKPSRTRHHVINTVGTTFTKMAVNDKGEIFIEIKDGNDYSVDFEYTPKTD